VSMLEQFANAFMAEQLEPARPAQATERTA
jgi:hypothetical protein